MTFSVSSVSYDFYVVFFLLSTPALAPVTPKVQIEVLKIFSQQHLIY